MNVEAYKRLVLCLVLLGVWGAVWYKHGERIKNTPSELTYESERETTYAIEKYQLKTSSTEIFGTLKSELPSPAPSLDNSPEAQTLVEGLPDNLNLVARITFPKVQIVGVVVSYGKKPRILLRHNGRSYRLTEGDVISGLLITAIRRNEVSVQYKGLDSVLSRSIVADQSVTF